MEQISIFENENSKDEPLAARMRPRDLGEFVGQQHLVGDGKILSKLIESDKVPSMIFQELERQHLHRLSLSKQRRIS